MPDFDLAALAAQFPWWSLSLSIAVAIGSILVLAPVARHAGWVDKPGLRKTHEGDVPLVGGWALLAAMVTLQAAAPSAWRAPVGYWVGALLLFIVALIDDRYPIRARYRFLVQIVAAIAGVSLGGQALADIGDLFGWGSVSAWWIVIPVSVIGTVAVINAVNFMDGADGLCGGVGFIGLFWYLMAVAVARSLSWSMDEQQAAHAAHAASLIPLAAATMGGLAGFLVFNLRTPWRRKAAVFLGDSGSMLVGFTLAWFAIHVTTAYGAASVSPVVCLWIMAIPLFDSASCIVRRLLAGVTPMTPDTRHLHHLVQTLGFSVAHSVYLIYAAAFACGFVGVTGWWMEVPEPTMFASFIVALVAFVVVTNLAWRWLDKRSAVASRQVVGTVSESR